MPEDKLDLSIVIVTWNAEKLLKRCLDSIYAESKNIALEVWVIDNNSEDETRKMIKERFPEVKLIANSGNPGFAKANNQAIKKTRGDFILILNPDILIQNRAIEKALFYAKKHPDLGMVGVRLTDKDGHPQLTAGRKLPSIWGEICLNILRSPFPQSKMFGSYTMGWWDHKSRREVEAICGAFMLMPANLLKRLGGFDESFFMYGEDVDLCFRTKKSGKKIMYLGDIPIIHFGAKSTNYSLPSIYRASLAGVESSYRYFKKNKSQFYAKSYKLVIRFFAFWELLARFFINILPKNKNDSLKKIKIKIYKNILCWKLDYET